MYAYVGDHRSMIGTSELTYPEFPSMGLLAYFNRTLRDVGYVITRGAQSRPWNHHVIGVGVQHDDAEFAEVGRSQAAFYENGEAFGRTPFDYLRELLAA